MKVPNFKSFVTLGQSLPLFPIIQSSTRITPPHRQLPQGCCRKQRRTRFKLWKGALVENKYMLTSHQKERIMGCNSLIWIIVLVSDYSTSLPVGPDIEARARLIKVWPHLRNLSYFGSQASYRTFLLGCLPGPRFRASLERELWSRWVSPSAPSTWTSPVGRSAPVAGWLLSGTTQGGGTFEKEGTILQ